MIDNRRVEAVLNTEPGLLEPVPVSLAVGAQMVADGQVCVLLTIYRAGECIGELRLPQGEALHLSALVADRAIVRS
jgi:hypothetical protein